MNNETMSLEEYLDLSRHLELHASIFYKLWESGRPVFSDETETSAVQLDKENNLLKFMVNPTFWKPLIEYGKVFVIAHECMHILLNHGTRSKYIQAANRQAANVAMDLAINHLLANNFGFDRKQLGPLAEQLCWVDKIFPGENVPDNESFEFYYNLFEKQYGNCGGNSSIDDLDGLGEIAEWFEKEGKGAVEKEDAEQLSKKIGNSKNEGQAGKQAGLGDFINEFLQPEKKKIQNKWQHLFRNMNKKSLGDNDKEQWARPSRRFATLSSDMMIPTENNEEDFAKEKISVYLFIDVSGSCDRLRPYFFKMARSINKKFFDVRAFAFSQSAHPISLDKQLQVGAGTNFGSIEIVCASLQKYPDHIMVFTDGEDQHGVRPKKPKVWKWFLPVDGEKRFIPTKSKIYMLRDFE